MITPSFHFKILEEFLEVMNEQVQILVDLFERKVGNEPFDVQPYLAHYALDIICGIYFILHSKSADIMHLVAICEPVRYCTKALATDCWSMQLSYLSRT